MAVLGQEGSAKLSTAAENGAPVVRAWPEGIAIVALGACVVCPIGAGVPVRTAVVGSAVAFLFAWAMLRGVAAVQRAALYIGPLFCCFASGTLFGWPPAVTTVLICVVPLACLLTLGRRLAHEPLAPWVTRGKPTLGTMWLSLATVVLSAASLTVWAVAVQPQPPQYLRDIQRLPAGVAVLGIVAFSLVNAVWEEMLFRGVLLTELESVWGFKPAVVLQSVLFGAAHFGGFPSGLVGVIMAGTWGLVLGFLRRKSGGLLNPYLVHVAADSVIAALAVLALR